MALAIAATAVLILAEQLLAPDSEGISPIAWAIIIVGTAIGGGLGLYTARIVKMTAMPQLVSLFNAVGGGAAALIAHRRVPAHRHRGRGPHRRPRSSSCSTSSSARVTFTGSLIASGKLQGLDPRQADLRPGRRSS